MSFLMKIGYSILTVHVWLVGGTNCFSLYVWNKLLE